MDPFGVTCDTRLYVPRLGTEAALAALLEGFAHGRAVSVLSGPPGLGKTMVLHVLAARVATARCLHLPYAALGIEELAHWALALLGEAARPERATNALAATALREPNAPLVLLVDDASALPAPTARALRELVDALGGALRVIAAVVDDSRASAAIAALGEGVLNVRLRHALAAREVHAYVRGRIASAGASDAGARLGDEQIDWLAAESAGVPRIVNALATGLLRERGTASRIASARTDSEDEACEDSRAAKTPRDPRIDGLLRARADASCDPAAAAAQQTPRAPRKRRRLRRSRGWY